MLRLASSAAVALVIAASAPVSTAATAQQDDTRVHVVGCVERVQPNGSLAGTGVGTTASPNVADRQANSNELLDRFQLSGAVRTAVEASATSADLTSYALEGSEAELTKHTGHRVEISGRVAPPRATAPRQADRAAAGSPMQRIIVESVKMRSANCTRQP
jgi:hypothetical protein